MSAEGLNDPFLFTPRRDNGERVAMTLSVVDFDKVMGYRGCDWEATVTDQRTGKVYVVMGAECPLPGCYCDAIVVREISQVPARGH